ncbi:MAG: serine/threonine protein kinase, partial [Planctomycetota bacterium]
MERFGSFTLFERIGFGGMCEVFRARRDGDERDYALKRLHAQLEENPEVVDLFLTEADIAVMLKHPNLITAYESGEVEGHYFISMELVDGLDLNRAERLAQTQARPVELQLALHIVSEVCNGLDYLHNARSPAGRSFELVHRDVSPDNVFLTRSGKVKVADFGLAKLGALETITAVIGTVKGKLPFMAPEQLRGD